MSGEHRYDSAGALAGALAGVLAARLHRAVDQRGGASLVVSGGSTPLPLFRALRILDLPWHRVTVTLADDRWVPPTHPRSNEGMVRRELLAHEARAARLVGLVDEHATPREGLATCRRRLDALPRPFDVVVLGMGADGHFASLFPGAEASAAALDPGASEPCVAVDPPGDLEPRISLTLPTLIDARHVVLHITGTDKWATYRAARDGTRDDLPITRLLRAASEKLEVHWAP